MAGELLRNSDCNVISVDWSLLSGPSPFYLAAAANARPVGVHAARFLRGTLMDRRVGLRMEGVRVVVGFSLGAQAVGNMGNALDGRLGRISGLDPAGKLLFIFKHIKSFFICVKNTGPMFHTARPSHKLTRASAKFVDVIHAAGRWIGTDGRVLWKLNLKLYVKLMCSTSCSGRSR